MKAPFENGQRVKSTGTLYSWRPQPVIGTVVGYNPISRHIVVVWDFHPESGLLEYVNELEAIA